jgi:hypothetical protein
MFAIFSGCGELDRNGSRIGVTDFRSGGKNDVY